MADLITTHPNADFDGVASMVAARHLYPGAILAFSGSAEEAVRQFMADQTHIRILTPRQVDTTHITRLILCDTHTPERAGHFEDLARTVPLHVYDHHPINADDIKPQRAVIAPIGATTTLLAEALMAQGISLSAWEATLMALGLYEETGSLTYASTTPRDLSAAAWLLGAGADLEVVRQQLSQELNMEQLELLDALAHQMEVRYLDGYKVGLATAHAAHYVPELAGVASRLLAMQPMDALLMLVAMDNRVLLVGRGNRPEIPLGEVAGTFGGGGHPTAASAMLHDVDLVSASKQVWSAVDRLIAPLRTAAALMTPKPATIPHDVPLKEVERALTRYGVSALPVMDGPRLVGIITRETVQKALFHDMGTRTAADLMEADPYAVTPTTPLREVQDQMVTHNLHFVPVVATTGLVGCITRTDLLRTMHGDLQPARVDTPEARRRTVRDLMRQRLPAALYDLLTEIGRAGESLGMGVYMVGGIVRDLLLERDNLDIDLVVEGDAITFARAWAVQHGDRVHAHERFATATVTLEREGLPTHFKVDFATARTEFYAYPSALPTVEHSSLKKDLYRRDFTINALAVALQPSAFGQLIDYFGGRRDLESGRIRVLHTLSFTEDPTRALRAVRFSCRFGFAIGPQSERLIRAAGDMGLYTRLSGKRLRTELVHLLSEPDPVAAIGALEKFGVLAGIEPAFAELDSVVAHLTRLREAITWYHLQYVSPPLSEWQAYLMGIGDGLPTPARERFWDRLDLPGRLRQTWDSWRDLSERAAAHLPTDPAADPLAVYHTLHGAPPEVLLNLMAGANREPVKQAVSHYLSHIAGTRILLDGDDLKHLGIPPGPAYKEILTGLLWARIEGRVGSREDEENWVKGFIGSR